MFAVLQIASICNTALVDPPRTVINRTAFSIDFEQDIIRPINNPIKTSGHIRILYGNLACEGSVAKITGKEGLIFKGKANVFNCENDANNAIKNKSISKGEVIVF